MNYKINNIYNEDSYEAIKKIPNKSIVNDPSTPHFIELMVKL